MPVGERVKVDSLDVCNYYSHGSTIISGKLIRFRIESFLKTIRH
ncbi:hypothetical protein Godav_029978 [Gossypium davidsonii]|uniref:Uncharacterized protein n=1 Tax=Gossypium davidsonii TaxID=34287 RepID=A0A7J8TG09_GOSDV|nr:hypothetical protein [Gossypium davidsonii]MBA0637107.1 hypothetical protein [Gossypium davidsonii]